MCTNITTIDFKKIDVIKSDFVSVSLTYGDKKTRIDYVPTIEKLSLKLKLNVFVNDIPYFTSITIDDSIKSFLNKLYTEAQTRAEKLFEDSREVFNPGNTPGQTSFIDYDLPR